MLWYSLEAPCRGASDVYPQHMFLWRDTPLLPKALAYGMLLIISAKLRKPDSLTVKLILKTRRRKFTPDYTILGEVMVCE